MGGLINSMYAALREQGIDSSALWAVLIGIYLFGAMASLGVFRKAGQPLWAAFVPIVDQVVLILVARRPWWLAIPLFFSIRFGLILVPSVFVWAYVAYYVARSFGKNWAWAIGVFLLPPVFLMILGWGKAEYVAAADPARELVTA